MVEVVVGAEEEKIPKLMMVKMKKNQKTSRKSPATIFEVKGIMQMSAKNPRKQGLIRIKKKKVIDKRRKGILSPYGL